MARHDGVHLARRVVTLGSPLHGEQIAAVGSALVPGACPIACQQLVPGSALLTRLDGERLRPLWLLPLQQVVYRQLMYLVTIQSVITALIGTRQRWQAISRTGVFADLSA